MVSVISWFLWEAGPAALLLDKPLGHALQEPGLRSLLLGQPLAKGSAPAAPGCLCPQGRGWASRGGILRAKFKGVSPVSK